jgi:hypothetical protein
VREYNVNNIGQWVMTMLMRIFIYGYGEGDARRLHWGKNKNERVMPVRID